MKKIRARSYGHCQRCGRTIVKGRDTIVLVESLGWCHSWCEHVRCAFCGKPTLDGNEVCASCAVSWSHPTRIRERDGSRVP